MNGRLLRTCDSPFGIFGYLDLLDDAATRQARFVTAEDDWLDNAPHLSAIPAGTYPCRRTVWERTGLPTFEILEVPQRSRILFHWGNTEEDTTGCIVLGKEFGALTVQDEDRPGRPRGRKWAVLRSREAVKEFLARLEGVREFPLTIRWSRPGEWRP